MPDETTLSDDDILTSPAGETRLRSETDTDEGDGDTDTTDADTDDTDSDADGTDA
jgi:hypothetical protein